MDQQEQIDEGPDPLSVAVARASTRMPDGSVEFSPMRLVDDADETTAYDIYYLLAEMVLDEDMPDSIREDTRARMRLLPRRFPERFPDND